MLQQTTVVAVIPRYLAWIEQFPDVQALAAASEQEVLRAWQGLGYYTRAKRLREAALVITKDLGGDWPRTAQELKKLPGIGTYTAAAVASFAFGEAVAVVDANVSRVVARLDAMEKPVDTAAGRESVESIATAMLDRVLPATHNNAMMELGATVCLPRAPLCEACPVAGHCVGRLRGAENFPMRKGRRVITRLECEHVFVVSGRGILLRQQQGARWAGLWTLPEAELRGIVADRDAPAMLTLTYPITRYRVTLRVWPGAQEGRLHESCRWWPLRSLADCPMPSPHRKVLANLL